MDRVYIDVAARCAIPVGNKLLAYVNGKSIDNEKPELWPFGGGVATTDEGRLDLVRQFDAKEWQGDNEKPEDDPNDLRFMLPQIHLKDFEAWLKEQEKTLGFAQAAQRELEEECKKHGLPRHLADQIKFKGVKRRVDKTRDTWNYQGQKMRDAHCFDYIVEGQFDKKVAQEIEALVAGSEDLWLIGRDDVGKKIPGIIKGKPTEIKVPDMLGLLF